MKRKKIHESGFSLIESIIYLAIFVVLSVTLVNCIIVMTKTYTQTRINRDLLDSANVAMERMTRDIRGATSIVTGSGSTFGSNPGKLTINVTTSTTEVFNLVSGAVQFTDTTGTTNNLTSSLVSVDSLVFRDILTGQGSAIKIEMTLHSLRSSSAKSISLSDTVAIRSNY